jgi:hypothetical protein
MSAVEFIAGAKEKFFEKDFESKKPEKDFDVIVFSGNLPEHINPRPYLLAEEIGRFKKVLLIEPAVIEDRSENVIRFRLRKNFLSAIPYLTHNIHLLPMLLKSLGMREVPAGLFFSANDFKIQDLWRFRKKIFDISSPLSFPEKYLPQADVIISENRLAFGFGYSNFFKIPTPAKLQENRQEPDLFINPQRPILGYFGGINSAVNFKLLEETAELIPHATIVLTGPTESKNAVYSKNKNIKILPTPGPGEILSYLRTFDIALFPFKTSGANLPAHLLYKYFTLNKPIITTTVSSIPFELQQIIPSAANAQELIKSANNFISATKKEIRERKLAYASFLEKASNCDMNTLIQKVFSL